jgi:hypothetical protein
MQLNVYGRNGYWASTPLALEVNSNGRTTAYAPKPTDTTSTSSNQIATVGWVNSGNNNVVHLTGDQTIADTKTFSSSPVVPTPNSSDNSKKSANTAFVKNVLSSSGKGLATISKAGNGYCKFTNGLIIQWGHAAAGGATVTLPTPFTSTNYQVALTQSENSEHNVIPTVSSKTGTNFYAGHHSWPIDWIAIGY